MSVDPLAEKYPGWSPYTYTLDNPVRLVDRDGMEAEDEWEIIINKDGTSSTRWISDRGGDKTDYIRTRNGIPIPQDGAIDYTYEVAVKSIATTSSSELPRGEIDKGPGYRAYDVGTGGAIESVYNDVALGFMPLPKLGLLGKLKGALGFGAKEVVEGAAEGGIRINAGTLKEFKSLVKQISKPGSELTKAELTQLEKLTTQFGGKLRYDLNPVKGKILKPHVQIEGLGSSVKSRHIWLGKGVK